MIYYQKSFGLWPPPLSKNMKSMRKQAPSITAFIFTSRSKGNWIPKVSTSVSISFRIPDQCLEILPTTNSSSRDLISCYFSSSVQPGSPAYWPSDWLLYSLGDWFTGNLLSTDSFLILDSLSLLEAAGAATTITS